MTYFAEKLIGLVLCTVFGFTVALGAPNGQSEPVTTIALAPYLISPARLHPAHRPRCSLTHTRQPVSNLARWPSTLAGLPINAPCSSL
jgi:hypothetical protein